MAQEMVDLEALEAAELKEIGARLHALRFRARLSLEAVEDATGLGASSISKWERGLVEAGVMGILRLCAFYDVQPDWVLSELGTKRVSRNGEPQVLELIPGGGTGTAPIQTSLFVGVASS